MLLLTSCAGGVESAPPPPIERVTPPAATHIPDGGTPCSGNPTAMCLTDSQNAGLLRSYEAGERARDRQLCWLRVWFGYPACPVD